MGDEPSGSVAGSRDAVRSVARSELMRAEVRKVAADVFANGAPSAGLQDVADRMGISRPALYRYFSSKDALVTEIIADHSRRSAEIISQAVPDASPEVRLHDLVRRLAIFVIHHPEAIRMFGSVWPALSEEARAMASEMNHAFFASLRPMISEGIDRGVFRDVDPGVAAQSLVAMTRSLAIWFEEGGRLSAEEVADQTATMGVAGLLAPTAAAAGLLGSAHQAVEAVRSELDRLEGLLSQTASSRGSGANPGAVLAG